MLENKAVKQEAKERLRKLARRTDRINEVAKKVIQQLREQRIELVNGGVEKEEPEN